MAMPPTKVGIIGKRPKVNIQPVPSGISAKKANALAMEKARLRAERRRKATEEAKRKAEEEAAAAEAEAQE